MFTLVLGLSLTMAVPVAAETLVEGTTCEIVGDYYSVNFTVTDDGPTVTWTFDMIGDKVLEGNGHWGYGLAISLDGEKPAFQIHNNDGTDANYTWGTHLYSPYLNGWQSGTTNTPVSELDWVTCTGDRDIADNPNGVFTVTIDKAELGLEFYWAIWFGVGGFYNPNNGYSSYPDGFMWDEDVTAGHYEPCSLPANTAVGLTAETSTITAINVDPTSIDFGTITPGTPNDGDNITVENIGGVTVDVDAYLAPMTNTVFNYLKLGGVPSPGYCGDWADYIISGLKPSLNQTLTTQLVVPETYSGKGIEIATLVFEASPA